MTEQETPAAPLAPTAAPASTPPDCAACETLKAALAEAEAKHDALLDSAAQVEQERDSLILKINQLAEDAEPEPAPKAESDPVEAEIQGNGVLARIRRGLSRM